VALAEESLSQAFAVGQIGGRESLERFGVANGDQVLFADVVFLRAVDERYFQFVEVRRLVAKVVKFTLGRCILDVIYDFLQHVDAERTWSQLLVKRGVDDPLKNADDSSEFVAVGDHLGNGSVNTEVESSLNFELLDFIANVFDHLIQLMEVLFVDVNNVRKQIRFLLFFFNRCLQFGDLDGVVGGQRECGGGSDERSDVPLTALTFLHVRKACQKIIEEFENLFKVRFVNFESAVQSGPVSLIKVEIKTIEVWNAAIHTLNHSVLKLEKSRVVKWDPYVTDES
jgi:hypothetical protein